jgi:hypothetical protein
MNGDAPGAIHYRIPFGYGVREAVPHKNVGFSPRLDIGSYIGQTREVTAGPRPDMGSEIGTSRPMGSGIATHYLYLYSEVK